METGAFGMISDVRMFAVNLAKLEVLSHWPMSRLFELEVAGARYGLSVSKLEEAAPFAGQLPADPEKPSLVEVAEVVKECFTRLLRLELDPEAAWSVYREELAVTTAQVLPVWENLDPEVKESFCTGLRRAVGDGVEIVEGR